MKIRNDVTLLLTLLISQFYLNHYQINAFFTPSLLLRVLLFFSEKQAAKDFSEDVVFLRVIHLDPEQFKQIKVRLNLEILINFTIGSSNVSHV